MKSIIPYGTRYPQLLEDFRQEFDRAMSHLTNGGNSEYFSPLCNVAELESHYEIAVDLPGVNASDVDVELRHGDLWISGERKDCCHGREGMAWLRNECPIGKFQRVLHLGDDLDADKVDAAYKDGVLHITVPKAESAKTKHITVRT